MEEKYKANSKSDFKIKTKVKLNDKPEKYKATSVNDVVEVNNTSSKSQIINETKSASVATDVSNEVSSQEYNKSEDFMPSQLNNENNPLTRNNQNNIGMDQNNFVQKSKRPNEELNEQIIDNQKKNSRNDSDDDNDDISNNNNNQINNDNGDMNNNNFADDNMGMNDSSNIMSQQNYNSFNTPNNRRPRDNNGNLNNDNENDEKKEENRNDYHDNKTQGKPDNKRDENKEKDKTNNNKQDSKQADKQDNQNPNKKDETANNKDKNQNNKTDNKQDNKNNSKNNENKQNNDNKTNPNNNVANKNNNSNNNNSENKKLSLKDRTKNFAKNQFNKTKTGQTVNEVKEKYESLKSLILFIKTHPYVIVIFLAVVVLLFILLIIIGTVGAYAAAEEEEAMTVNSYSYYGPNFSQLSINIVDQNGNVLEENVSMSTFIEGMTYVYLGENATKEQYKAFMVVAKGYLLSSVNFTNTQLNVSIQNTDNYLLYCNIENGCQVGPDNHYYPANTEPSYTNVSPLSSDKSMVIETAYDETIFDIIAPEGTTSFETINEVTPFSVSIINQIKNNSEADYKSIISLISDFTGFEVINAESTFQVFTTAGCSVGTWIWPVGSKECTESGGVTLCLGTPTQTKLSANYPRYPKGGYHNGIDINNQDGTANGSNVIAAFDGVVTFAGWDTSGFGNLVVIKHDEEYKTYYGHMQNGSIKVKVGDRVVAGQLLGKIGSTGNSTGPHLHFSVKKNDEYDDPNKYVSVSNTGAGTCLGSEATLVQGVNDKQTICKTLLSMGFNNNAVAAIMSNLQAESSFNPSAAEHCDTKGASCHNDYTNKVNSKSISESSFVHYSKGYGLIQWTYYTRKQTLYDNTIKKGLNINDIAGQINTMVLEVKGYGSVYKMLMSNESSYDIGYTFCSGFEKPSTDCNARMSKFNQSNLDYVNKGCN